MTWTVKEVIRDRYELLALKRDRPGHQVWLALDQSSQAQVIIKTLAFTGAIQWEEVQLFEREISVLKRLHHPQLPSFVDAFNLEKPYFQKCLVETYIHAPTLQAFLDRKQSIPQSQIWAIATQILTILKDLHSLDPPILHRDLKPSNLLIDSEKTVYLIDLGSIGLQEPPNPVPIKTPTTKTPTTVGSYGYTPMDQFMGQSTPASDLYGLGAVLMELLTGLHPSELMTSQSRLALPASLTLAAPLRQWIYQLTEPDISHRFNSAAQALQKLQQSQAQAKAIAQMSQDVSLSHQPKRVTVHETSQGQKIIITSVWNRQTIATSDVLLLSGLATVPPLLGLTWAIALSSSAQGFSLLGTDVLLLSLSVLPSYVIFPKLWRYLVEQTIDCTSSHLIVKRKIAGMTLRILRLPRTDLMSLQLQSHTQGWSISATTPSGQLRTIASRLPPEAVDTLYKHLEQWQISEQN